MTDPITGSGPVGSPSLPWSPVPDEAGENGADFDSRRYAAADEDTAIEPQGLVPQLTGELTTLRKHVETVEQDVAALVARVHALSSAIVGVEVAIGDRLTEYADTVVQLGRGLTTNITTYREGNERTIAELRRALADSDELLRGVLTKSDDLAVELATVRSELTTQASDDSVDVDELRDVVRDAVEPLDVRGAIGNLAADLAGLGDRLTNTLATATAPSVGVDAAMQAEVLTALEGMRAELERVGRAEEEPKGEADSEQDDALAAELEAMRVEIAGLKRRIALRTAKLTDEEVERVADAVAHRISQAFEVVPDDEPAPAPKPASKRPTKASTPHAKTAKRTSSASARSAPRR